VEWASCYSSKLLSRRKNRQIWSMFQWPRFKKSPPSAGGAKCGRHSSRAHPKRRARAWRSLLNSQRKRDRSKVRSLEIGVLNLPRTPLLGLSAFPAGAVFSKREHFEIRVFDVLGWKMRHTLLDPKTEFNGLGGIAKPHQKSCRTPPSRPF
jgi:hypothetical protein